MVNVLVVGSGGREHAISWKISQSKNAENVFTAPGNGGTENNIPIQVDQIDKLADFAAEKNCFTIVGPEAPLANGIVDAFNEKNLKISFSKNKFCYHNPSKNNNYFILSSISSEDKKRISHFMPNFGPACVNHKVDLIFFCER